MVFGLIAVAGARIWVQNRVDLSQNSNLIMVAVTLVLGAGDFALSLGGFTLGGSERPPSASFTHALLNAAHVKQNSPVTPLPNRSYGEEGVLPPNLFNALPAGSRDGQ